MLKFHTTARKGFTLIELLIVVAIIAILAAIAVPNFLEAQTRSKISRVKSDLRTIAMAMESYAIDTNGKFPILNGYVGTTYTNNNRGGIFLAWGLTTPVAYLGSTAIADPFNKKQAHDVFGQTANTGNPGDNGAESFTDHYLNVPECRREFNKLPLQDKRPKYFLLSYGPDYVKGPDPTGLLAADQSRSDSWLADYAIVSEKVDPKLTFDMFNYDPTNGTVSGGDIIRHQ